jgi:hypothetical protein
MTAWLYAMGWYIYDTMLGWHCWFEWFRHSVTLYCD